MKNNQTPKTSENKKEGKNRGLKKSKKPGKNKYAKTIKITLLVISMLLILLLALSYFSISPAISAYYNALQAEKSLALAQQSLEELKLSGSTKALQSANEDLTRSQDSLSKLKWLKAIPFINIQYNAINLLLSAGIQTSSAFISTLETTEKIIEPVEFKNLDNIGGLTAGQKEEILKNLYQSTPAFESAYSKLELSEIELEKMPSYGVVSQIEEAKNQLANYLPQSKQFLEKAIVLSKLLPRFGGYPEQKEYLILFQNNTEIRPGGGFLGSYGVLKVKGGEITDLKTDDTYNLDDNSNTNITPPWQIPKLVHPGVKTWYFRDSNWYPDFPSSALNAEWIYHEEGGEENFDGEIAIDTTFIEYLLEVTGPVKIEGFPIEFNSENVTELLEYAVEKRFAELGIKYELRKSIIGELASKIIDKIFSLPKEQITPLLTTVQNSLLEKHLMIYAHYEEMQKYLEEENWAGKVMDTDGDYFLSADANMASLKTDAYVDRKIDYEINLGSNNQAEVNAVLTYKNNAPGFSWKTTRYRDWNKIYVPLGSELISIEGNEKGEQYYNEPGTDHEIHEEHGKMSIGTFISIEPGEEGSLTYKYKLPEHLTKSLKENGYKLLLQKQPGTIDPELKVTVISNENIVSMAPNNIGILLENNKKTEFKTNLLTDKEFLVNFK